MTWETKGDQITSRNLKVTRLPPSSASLTSWAGRLMTCWSLTQYFAYLWPWTWSPIGRPCVISNALTFLWMSWGELERWWQSVCCPLPAVPRLLRCFTLRLPGGAVLLDESSISRGPDDLAGGDRHPVDSTEACNQSWQLQDPVGLLRVHRVFCGHDPCKQLMTSEISWGEVHTYLCHDGMNLMGGRAPCRTDRGP